MMRTAFLFVAAVAAGQIPPQALTISAVTPAPAVFNPSNRERTELRYTLSQDATVTIQVWDADRELVQTLVSKAVRKAGRQTEAWNGRDSRGRAVPNEAYFFTIEAETPGRGSAVYDPITFSGGDFADITRADINRAAGTVSYGLSRPSRVLLRAGLSGSVLLRTLVDWEPRAAGSVTETWNGWDEDHLVQFGTHPQQLMILTYVTLPEASVITIGNQEQSYRAYKAARATTSRIRKPERPMRGSRRTSPHFQQSRLLDRTFRVRLAFPDFDKGATAAVPEVRDRIMVRIDVDPADRAVLANQQFETMMYNDMAFHAEEERGYVPMLFPWELQHLAPGEHILTVNISTHGDQVGVGSRKIKVVR